MSRHIAATTLSVFLLTAGSLAAMEMGKPASITAEEYGHDAAEMGACDVSPATLKAYIGGAMQEIQKKSKKPVDANNNLAIFQQSYQEQAADYKSEKESPSCGDLETRLLPVGR